MRYKLYLDDLRYPPADTDDWRLARNYHDALWYVKTYGIPYHISFDHDLGPPTKDVPIWDFLDNPYPDAPADFTGMDFAKWFCLYVLDNGLDLPDDFTYNVHSQNPVGADNIRSYMASFLKDGYAQ